MKRHELHFVKVCSVLLAVFFWANRAGAQATTGSIYGRVTDSSKAIVVGAKVVATKGQNTHVTASAMPTNGELALARRLTP